MESLYTILNGDDLYVTFQDAHFSSQSYAVNLFSELYLVLFIFIFVYIMLSLFIGIFNQAYESLSVSLCMYVHTLLCMYMYVIMTLDTKRYSGPC